MSPISVSIPVSVVPSFPVAVSVVSSGFLEIVGFLWPKVRFISRSGLNQEGFWNGITLILVQHWG
jgi:hypothetical protein